MTKVGILGGTGECGKALIENLLKNNYYSNVHLIARRSTIKDLQSKYPNANLTESIISFDDVLSEKLTTNPFENCQQVFCCMGTTKANAGSAEAFIKIDKDYVLASAKYAKTANVGHFHYVSSGGANAKSSFLYPRTKGEIQVGLSELKFPALSIYQPGLLLCDRSESRPGEAVARFFGNCISKLTNSGSCSTWNVGAAMLGSSQAVFDENVTKVDYYSNAQIHEEAKKFQN